MELFLLVEPERRAAQAPKLRSLFGDAPYRLDHDYINLHDHEKPGRLYLHGCGQGAGGPSDLVGPTDGGQCYYRYSNGRFFNGLIAVGFELETVQPGHGGFGELRAHASCSAHRKLTCLLRWRSVCCRLAQSKCGVAARLEVAGGGGAGLRPPGRRGGGRRVSLLFPSLSLQCAVC